MRGLSLLLIVLALASAPPALRASASPVIRVGLLREQDRVTVWSDRGIELLASATRAVLPAGAYELTPAPGGVEVAGVGRFAGPVRLVPDAGGRLSVAGRPYRGILEIRPAGSGRLTVINELDLEEYLYGVIRMEVDPRWPAETLRAQAVAARTLALYSLNRFAAEGYDVRATTDSQVYGGLAAEDARTTAAVDATRGEIMTYQGRPIFAAFHADSGGHTESSELVWGGRYPYLVGVPDPYSAGPGGQQWVVRVSLDALAERLRRAGRPVEAVTGIEVAEVSPSGRALLVRIAAGAGTLTLRGTELRTILGADLLKSTLFAVRAGEDPAWVELAGRGAGHGVGMSQWGARGQGLAGRSYQDILRFYYTGVTLQTR